MVHHVAAKVAAKAVAVKALPAVAKGFMIVATVCGAHFGVTTCLRQADTNIVADRAECIKEGQKLVSDALYGFGYAHVVVGKDGVKIRCLPQGSPVTLEVHDKGKPDAVGTASAPVAPAPTVSVVVAKEKAPAPAPAPAWYSGLWNWPF